MSGLELTESKLRKSPVFKFLKFDFKILGKERLKISFGIIVINANNCLPIVD